LELTESLATEERVILETMQSLRRLGVSLAIDDFGTGYSSLSRLRHLPINHLKIDRSFVMGIGRDAESRSIVSMIIRMGHELGVSLIAEGVETVEQESELIRLGCQEAQGYLHYKPMSEGELEAILRRHAGQG
jgi:EAL domain-containing protein (putative c-di-GMP-specific phosphodiesterase class I)